ncbi:PTS ascorbate transporter subunit IIC [Anaerococcus porci]|uniref:PTS ascorbate transporter subunit IIC n=1 Tax=Anaerococcus porci TaxID=2652269 RepID=UPI002A757B6F|nr:PTS ascorbate transporter subunit IIC [Anaerococcus porci]MDY3006703.1 PTS ascorbate transporter subunit IIC [Anaerococcus porci]
MDILFGILNGFVKNILTKPAFFIGFIVLIGYLFDGKKWYDALAGFIKATVGYMILSVGSGGLVSTFRPILTGLKDRFKISATVIDPYFGQNAVTEAMGEIGKSFSQVMLLLLIAFVINIVLVRLKNITKMRAVFTTGHVQMQQAATAFWLVVFCFPKLGETPILIIMAILLGLYWAVGSNLTVEDTQKLTDGAGFCIAHQQMFGVRLACWLSDKLFKNHKENSKNLDDIELPGFLSIFNENMVATAILMTAFFGVIQLVLGKDYLVAQEALKLEDNFFFYILESSFSFAVNLAILQLGVRTFVGELTASFDGIQNKLLPGALPGIDCAAVFGFGSPNAVTIGFMFGALGQFLAIAVLFLIKSPTLIIAGFVPLFFDNAVIGTYANNRGGFKAAMLMPFLSGLIQVFGSAFIASYTGLAHYGGYLGMFDWATVWPMATVLMNNLHYIGIAIFAIVLIAIPQIEYRKNKDTYFMIVEDYEKYKEMTKNK